jgi:hypothetical protein
MGINYKVTSSYSKISCATAVVIDDVLNGNISYGGKSFFAGVNSLKTLMIELKNNIDQIGSNISLVSTYGL